VNPPLTPIISEENDQLSPAMNREVLGSHRTFG
jgi:hypothetical protein